MPGSGAAVTTETVTLYGLPIVEGRTVGYDRVDRATARRACSSATRSSTATGSPTTRSSSATGTSSSGCRGMEARVRRAGLLDDDAVFGFYDGRVGADVTSTRHFDRWWKQLRRRPGPARSRPTTCSRATAGSAPADYPDRWRDGDLDLPLTYRFDPGGPLDGVAVHVPLTALNQFSGDGLDWQIPGHRAELVAALVRTLPKDIRRGLIPAAETTTAAFDRLGPPRWPARRRARRGADRGQRHAR